MREKTVITPRDPERVHLVQITDSHILADPDARFDNVDTAATLEATVAAVNALAEPPDLVLVSGDLTHEPEAAAYDRLAERLQVLAAPVFCLPGNHDDPDLMHASLNRDGISTARVITAGSWLLLLLETWQAGTHGGRLSPAELAFLRDTLDGVSGEQVIIALHHPPVSIASSWMDAMGLANPQEFFDIIDTCEAVQAVIWGHIHQEFQQQRNGVDLLGTPSTCVQFKPGADRYIRDELPPGFRQLYLNAGGRMESRVRRLDAGDKEK